MATAPTTGEAAETAAESDPASEADEVSGADGATGKADQASGRTEDDTGSADTDEAEEPAGRRRLAIPPSLRRARPLNARPRRRIRLIDVLRVLGLARRAVPRPVVGPQAYPQWWQRLVALVLLAALVTVIGIVLAALVGVMVVVAGFLLEQAIS